MLCGFAEVLGSHTFLTDGYMLILYICLTSRRAKQDSTHFSHEKAVAQRTSGLPS